MADGQVARTPWAARWWHAIKAAFSEEVRRLTPLEDALGSEVSRLKSDVDTLRHRERSMKLELELAHGELRVARMEIQKLTEVCIRDRTRVQADTATFARVIAESQNGRESNR